MKAGSLRSMVLGLLVAACASGGPYGYARNYSPSSDEEDALENATEYDPVMSGRRKDDWVGTKVWVFGVVESVEKAGGGKLDILLSIRGLQGRNLCVNQDEESCRVTVTDHEFGKVHTRTKEAADKPIGRNSLLRVIGPISETPHPETGNWVIDSQFTRHWPNTEYVTMSEREFMRQ
jgi:hypothetical protein